MIRNTNVSITSEAIVIPETGRFEVPIVPVSLAETITNNKARINDTIAASTAIKILPEIKYAATASTAIPTKRLIISPGSFSVTSPFDGLAFKVSFIDTTIVGISLTAPMIPPHNIIPAPIYFT